MYALIGFFFFNDTATTEIYTLSLHDALPISGDGLELVQGAAGVSEPPPGQLRHGDAVHGHQRGRSEEHTSELQSRQYLVCRLLLEKKKHDTQSHQSRQLTPVEHRIRRRELQL